MGGVAVGRVTRNLLILGGPQWKDIQLRNGEGDHLPPISWKSQFFLEPLLSVALAEPIVRWEVF